MPYKKPDEMDSQLVMQAVGIKPTEGQLPILEDVEHRIIQVTGGWRAGKSEQATDKLTIDCAVNVPHFNDLYWIVGPDYEQARPEFFRTYDYLSRINLVAAGGLAAPREGPLQMTLRNGTRILTKSASDPERLGSEAPRGVLMVEAAQQPYEAFLNLQGRIAEKRGWMNLSGTFRPSEGKRTVQRWYEQMYHKWLKGEGDAKAYSLPSWSNTAIFPGGRNDPEILRLENSSGFTEEDFMERFGGVPSPAPGIVFPMFNYATHVQYKYPEKATSFDPNLSVHLGIDPGWSHRYAVLAFQKDELNKELWIIDQVYHEHHTTEEMIQETYNKPWGPASTVAIIDHQGGRQHLDQRYTAKQKWERLWPGSRRLQVASKWCPLAAGYEAHANLLQGTVAYERTKGTPLEHKGWKLYIDPKVSSLVGGYLDGDEWGGEYFLHKNTLDSDGRPIKDLPKDRDNDAIKAVSYYIFFTIGPMEVPGQRFQQYGQLQPAGFRMN